MDTLKDLEKKLEKSDSMLDEWSGFRPTSKEMGVVQFTLDRGVKTTVVGTVYGLDFEIENDDFKCKIFFDYYNKRLKLVDYEATNYSKLITTLAYLAEANHFDKIFIKTHKCDFQIFLSHGYMMEGILKYYFEGEDAFILSRFSTNERITSDKLIEESKLVENMIYQDSSRQIPPLPENIQIITAEKKHIPELVAIYRQVFETYPSPLTNPDYIESTIDRDVIYKLAMSDGSAIAAASADVDYKHSNAEMTDCATVPSAQGTGIMQHLLLSLETDLREKKLISLYTLARAMSVGMNKAFFKLDYEYSGRLINNCDIFGQFEDLNIWVKKI